jgi:hypothetical protein
LALSNDRTDLYEEWQQSGDTIEEWAGGPGDKTQTMAQARQWQPDHKKATFEQLSNTIYDATEWSCQSLKRWKVTYSFGQVKDTHTSASGIRKWTTETDIVAPSDARLHTLSLPHALDVYLDRTKTCPATLMEGDAPATYLGEVAVFTSLGRQTDRHGTRYRALKSNTVNNIMKGVLKGAGIDVTKYKAHSTRGASATQLRRNAGSDVPDKVKQKEVTAKARWRTTAVENKYYNRSSGEANDTDLPPLPEAYTSVTHNLVMVRSRE